MKREKHNTNWPVILLSAVLLLAAGCGASGAIKMTEPPPLTISAGDTSVEAVRLTYSWTSGNTGVEADAAHPLDIADQLPVIVVPEDGVVRLTFKTAPEQVTVLAWKASAARTNAYDKPDLSLTVTNKNAVTLPSDDRYLYEVHAFWEMSDRSGGDAYYGFASASGEE